MIDEACASPIKESQVDYLLLLALLHYAVAVYGTTQSMDIGYATHNVSFTALMLAECFIYIFHILFLSFCRGQCFHCDIVLPMSFRNSTQMYSMNLKWYSLLCRAVYKHIHCTIQYNDGMICNVLNVDLFELRSAFSFESMSCDGSRWRSTGIASSPTFCCFMDELCHFHRKWDHQPVSCSAIYESRNGMYGAEEENISHAYTNTMSTWNAIYLLHALRSCLCNRPDPYVRPIWWVHRLARYSM